jgi:carbamoyl-phosphate synthase small subunit
MKGYLALKDIGLFSGRYFGWADSCTGELVHFRSQSFCWDVLTDPAYRKKIVITDPVYVENRQPLPEENQSFMPHLSALVLLGAIKDSDSVEPGLTGYFKSNRICGFIPDRRDLLYDALGFISCTSGSLDREKEDAIINLQKPITNGDEDLRSVTAPYEYLWDLGNGEKPEEKYNVVIWDLGISYNLLRNLRKLGCRLRMVPPDTLPEDIVALHPDGVIIAGDSIAPENEDKIISRIERVIGIRPILGIGCGAISLASALGIETTSLNTPHFGTAIPVEDIRTGRVEATYQAHSRAIDSSSAERSGTTISHINVCDDSAEGFANDEYRVMGSLYSDSFEKTPYYFDSFIDQLESSSKPAQVG